MKSDAATVQHLLLDALPSELDGLLLAHGFARSATSLEYSRRRGESLQQIVMGFDVAPTYEMDAIAHVLPQVRLTFPAAQQITRMLLGTCTTDGGDLDSTFSLYLGNIAPKDSRVLNWYIYRHESPAVCLSSIRHFMDTWGLAFLNGYSSLKALTEGFERRDDALPRDRRFLLIIVAAYVALNDAQKAFHVLATRFGRPGTRRKYSTAFEYVEHLLAEEHQSGGATS